MEWNNSMMIQPHFKFESNLAREENKEHEDIRAKYKKKKGENKVKIP